MDIPQIENMNKKNLKVKAKARIIMVLIKKDHLAHLEWISCTILEEEVTLLQENKILVLASGINFQERGISHLEYKTRLREEKTTHLVIRTECREKTTT